MLSEIRTAIATSSQQDQLAVYQSTTLQTATLQSSKSQRQVKFKGANVNKVNQVTTSKQSKASSSSESGEVSDDNYDSEVSSSVNSVASHKPKRILVWEGTSDTHDSDQPSRKVSKIRSLRAVSLLRSASSGQIPVSDGDNTDNDMPPPLIRDSSDSDSDADPMRHDLNLRNRITATGFCKLNVFKTFNLFCKAFKLLCANFNAFVCVEVICFVS